MYSSLILVAATAAAFQTHTAPDGQPYRWQSRPITWTYEAQSTPEDLEADRVAGAIAAAAAAWSEVPDSDLLLEESPTGDAHGVVRFTEYWPHDPELYAITQTERREDGRIIGFTLELRVADVPWSTIGAPEALDVQNAVAHELGHAIGLDHVELPEATMDQVLQRGEIGKRSLLWDDEDGARALYPRGSLEEQPPLTGCSSLGASGSAWGLLLLVSAARVRNGRA